MDEYWSWASILTDLIKDRIYPPFKDHVRFIEGGPIMRGNSSWMNLTPLEARRKYGLIDDGSFYISVFDYSLLKNINSREALGDCSEVDRHYLRLDSIYEVVIFLLNQYPSVKIIFKIKRERSLTEDSDFLLYLSPEYKKMVDPDSSWMQSGRIVFLPANTDPYISVAMADLCISPPSNFPSERSLNV